METRTLHDQAVECIKREICSECACRIITEDNLLDCLTFDTCEVFKEEVEQTLKEWAEEDACRELTGLENV